MSKRDYSDYLRDMLDSINDTESFIRGMSFEEFKRDRKTVNAVVRSIEVIGEAASKMSKALRDKHKEIPWREMAGDRSRTYLKSLNPQGKTLNTAQTAARSG